MQGRTSFYCSRICTASSFRALVEKEGQLIALRNLSESEWTDADNGVLQTIR